MNLVTQAEFARMEGKSKSYINKLKETGRLVMEGDLVRVDASRERIAQTADPSKTAVAERHARQRSEHAAAAVNPQKQAKTGTKQAKTGTKPEPAEENDTAEERGTSPDYQLARARREEANANLAEIELAERAGELMQTSAVIAILSDAATTCRSMLETLPAILAPQLAALNNDHACRQLLEEHIGAALNELCDRLNGLQKEAQ